MQHITLYTFSTENFRRDSSELESLFRLFREKFVAVMKDERVHKNHIRVQMIGDRSLLPGELLATIDAAEEATRHYNDYFINIALAYGGRNEIVHAARSILDEVRDGAIDPAAIDPPATVEAHLNRGAPIPPVDLIIRTGNDYRTSNFLPPWLANGMSRPSTSAPPPTGRRSGRSTFCGRCGSTTSACGSRSALPGGG